MWFQQSNDGLVLFVVFYTQACRWSRCLGCNLPSTCSQFPVNYKNILNQIDYVFRDADVQKERYRIRKVIISNNGSVLDQETFSSMALMHLILQLNLHLPNLLFLSIETRAEYVEPQELEFISRGLKEGDTPTHLELAIGVEAFDDKVRNEVMRKGLAKKTIEKLVADMAPYHLRLKCYLMQKPVPGMSDEEGVEDVRNAMAYLARLATKHVDKHHKQLVQIGIHLNPTYAARGTLLEKAFLDGEYVPPKLEDVARAALFAERYRLPIFIGLSDEDLAVPGGSFIRDDNQLATERLEEFNRLQNYEILRSLTRDE